MEKLGMVYDLHGPPLPRSLQRHHSFDHIPTCSRLPGGFWELTGAWGGKRRERNARFVVSEIPI